MLITVLVVVVVDILLLSASGRMLGLRLRPLRILAGAFLGGVLTALIWLPNLYFLSHILWRIAVLIITGFVALGFSLPGVGLFLLLHLSLGNVTGTGNEMLSTLLGATGIALACILVRSRKQLVAVSLTHCGKKLHFTALRDTGNQLWDPLTGEPVLIVNESIARELTGLTPPELADPVNSIALFPGLRLIPYQTVGNKGFLLAIRIADARIGNRKGSILVAFSPRDLGSNYQALTGGLY